MTTAAPDRKARLKHDRETIALCRASYDPYWRRFAVETMHEAINARADRTTSPRPFAPSPVYFAVVEPGGMPAPAPDAGLAWKPKKARRIKADSIRDAARLAIVYHLRRRKPTAARLFTVAIVPARKNDPRPPASPVVVMRYELKIAPGTAAHMLTGQSR